MHLPKFYSTLQAERERDGRENCIFKDYWNMWMDFINSQVKKTLQVILRNSQKIKLIVKVIYKLSLVYMHT